MNNKTLLEQAKERNKLLLIESYSISTFNVEDLSTNKIFVESNNKKYECLAILRNVPISTYEENHNGRVYNRNLWERIFKENTAENTLSLADHPSEDSDGSVKDIVGVWKNLHLGNKTPLADLYLIDNQNSRTILGVIKLGGAIGLSSVGFGELLEDGKTVNPYSFELIRTADCVLSPSQGVFAKLENLEENIINKKIIPTKIEEKRKTYMNEDIFIFNARNQVKNILKESRKALEANNIEMLIESKRELLELNLPQELKEDKEKIDSQINIIESRLKENIKNTEEKFQENTKEYSSLKEKYNVATSTLNSLKEKHIKATEVIKIMSEDDKLMKEDIYRAIKDINLMREDIKKLTKDRIIMEKDLVQLVKDRKVMLNDINRLMKERKIIISDSRGFIQDRKLMESDIKKFIQDRKLMESDMNKLIQENRKLKSKFKEFDTPTGYNNLDFSDAYDQELPTVIEPSDEEADIVANDTNLDDLDWERDTSLDDELFSDDSANENFSYVLDPALQYSGTDPKYGTTYSGEGSETLTHYPEKRNKKPLKETKNISQKRNLTVPSITKIDIKKFYETEVSKNPTLKFVKEKILGSKTLVEAVRKTDFYLKNKEEKPVNFTQSLSKNQYDWLGDNRF